jgi:hypothetical protein
MKSPAAVEANERARALAGSGEYAAAIPHYLEAVRLAPSWCDPWFNLGIAYKHTCDFAGSLRACERALSIDPRAAGEGAVWNLGIAATALGDWAKARRAWRDFGLNLPAGEGPIEIRGVPTPIRINPRGDVTEVVWSLRIDPARARIRSLPLPASGHRYDDLVLHDGAPNGYRRFQGQDVPVFDVLTILTPSAYETWRVAVVAPSAADLEDLVARLRAVDVPAEDWTSVRALCDRCDKGIPHAHPGDDQAPVWIEERSLGMALHGTTPGATLAQWAAASADRSVATPERLL